MPRARTGRRAPPGLLSSVPSRILLAALGIEAVLFAAIAPNFATLANVFEVMRLSVEVGLLAVAMTPILVTGGVDLSVGALVGLAAGHLRRGDRACGPADGLAAGA